MQAAEAGAKIRFRSGCSEWEPCAHPLWEWGSLDYEVVPEPLVIWLNEYPDREFSLAYLSLAAADAAAASCRIRCIRFVEDSAAFNMES